MFRLAPAPLDTLDTTANEEDTPVAAESDFAAEMRAALSLRPREIAPKFFYDAEGSRLFDRICDQPEYYPTRTECALLAQHAPEMARRIGPGADLVEFGAGSIHKVRLLLDALQRPRRFIPVDISVEHLHASAERLRRDHPGLEVTPIGADFTQPIALPPATRRVGFFPGSSIGNFSPADAVQFLRTAARSLRGGGLLVGVDLVKSPSALHSAYNDAAGVTAAFNRNLLWRANRELGTNFDPDAFGHYAFYEPRLRRIEMHLVSRRRQTVALEGQAFEFEEGESLHTENSHKYTVDGFQALARRAGLLPAQAWVDAGHQFSVHWLDVPA